MGTLEQVASTFRTVAQTLIRRGYTGWKKAPYDTGNLYRTVGSFNSNQKMIKKQGNKSFITFNYSPIGANYGKYVEKGTYKMKSRPFAYTAANSAEVKKAIKAYQDSEVLDINKNVQKRVTLVIGKGFKKKK